MAAALRTREPRAVSALVDAVGERLLRSAYLLCGHEADAQDLVQETFFQALRTAHRYRGESSVYTWLHGILLNLTRHYHRERKRIVACETVPEAAATEECPVASDRVVASSALQTALLKLSEPHREILVLRFYEHMRVYEIAEHLGISDGTVKSRLHYALNKMQKLMPEEMNLFGSRGTEVRTR